MVALISKETHQIQFPGGNVQAGGPPLHHEIATTVMVETGVAVFTLLGTNPNDWTRDTVSFPVGVPTPRSDYINGIASAAPTSFWTPMTNLKAVGGGGESIPVNVSGSDSDGGSVSASGEVNLEIPGTFVPPPVGVAIDSAEVAYSDQSGQPVLTLAVAAFGNCAAMLRASYTAYLITGHDNVTVESGKGGANAPPSA
jgi:hypothetical protein